MSADGGKNDAGAQRALGNLQKFCAVLHHHRYVVSALDPRCAQQMRHLIRPTVQLGIGHHLPRIGHDVGRAIRRFSGEGRKMRHSVSLFIERMI